MNSMALWQIFPGLTSTTELRCIHPLRCREILRPWPSFPTKLTASRRWPLVLPHTGVLKAETSRISGSRASTEIQQSMEEIVRDVASEKAVEGPKEVYEAAREARKKIGEESIGKVEKEADEASEAASAQAAVEEPKETRETENLAPFAGSSSKETTKNFDTEVDEIVRDVTSEMAVEGPKEVHVAARQAQNKAGKGSLEGLEKKAHDFSEASSAENPLSQKAVEVASEFAVEDSKEIHHEALKKAEDLAPLVGSSVEETAKNLETKAEEIADEESEVLKSDLEDDSREEIHRYKTEDQEGSYKEDVTVLQDGHGNGDYDGEPRVDVKSREEISPNQGAQIHDDDSRKSTFDAKMNEDQKSRAIQDGSVPKQAHSSSEKIDNLVMDAKRNEDQYRRDREDIPILQKAQSYDAKIDSFRLNGDKTEKKAKGKNKGVPVLQTAQSHDEEIDKSMMDANKTEYQERGDRQDVPTSQEAENHIETVEDSTTRQDARRPSVEEISGNVREAMEKWEWAVESVIASGAYTRQQLQAMKGAAQKRARGFGEAAKMVREVCTKAAEMAAESWGKAAKHSEEVREVVFRNWEQIQKNMEQKIEDEGDKHVNDGEDHSASSHGVDEETIEAAKETGKANGGNNEGIEARAVDVEETPDIGESRF